MCGILGGYSFAINDKLNQRVSNALNQMNHRGPNDSSTYFNEFQNGEIFLGHKRLSIIDLTIAGKQPMETVDKRYSIVFNGEIYNYKEIRNELESKGYTFKTQTDTEVLLYSWIEYRENILPRLKGMFAFVIYDSFDQTLTCIRDAFGIKPFFFLLSEYGFYFASEVYPVLTLSGLNRKVNLQKAYNYLIFCDYDSSEDTFFCDIKHLMPAHLMVFDLGKKKIMLNKRWWWPSIEERVSLNFNDAAEYLREAFLDNLRLHLRSDVPVGAALSGGIDSSSVVCGIRKIEPDIPINTFSFLSPGQKFDESQWINIVNNRVKANSYSVTAMASEFVEDIDDMILSQGEPFTSTSIYAQYRVFKLAKENGIVVTLDGQGADEILAGYSGYPVQRIISLIDQNKYADAYLFYKEWIKWPGRTKSEIINGIGNRILPDSIKSIISRLIGLNIKPNWLNTNFLKENSVVCEFPVREISFDSFKRRIPETLRSLLTKNGLQGLLRHADRNSMRWSIESRVPFLTTDFAEFTLSLPEEYLVGQNGQSKNIFRHAMREIIPDEIINRKDKIGFVTPQDDWLSFMKDDIDHWLIGIDDIPFLNSQLVKRKIYNSLLSNSPIPYDIWRIINLCRWIHLNKISCY